jgi:subtilase-type serine protease
MITKRLLSLIIGAVALAALCACAASGTGRLGLFTPESPEVRDFLPSGAPPQLQTLDVPLTQFPNAIGTFLTGIRKSYVTGAVLLRDGRTAGLLYNRTSGVWTRIAYPRAKATTAYGPDALHSGYRVVGSYDTGSVGSHGFVYDSKTNVYFTVDAPKILCAPKKCNYTIAHSVYGDSQYKVVGNYDSIKPGNPYSGATKPASGHAFLYDSEGPKFSTIDFPGAASTTAYGIWIDGSTVAIAGGYADSKGQTHAYVRSLSSSEQVTFDYPGAKITHFEGITGAGGAGNYNVIGDAHSKSDKLTGFFLPIRNWQVGTPVAIGSVTANSVFKNIVIGIYRGNHTGLINGYITKVH